MNTNGACATDALFFANHYSINVSADGKTLTRVRFNCTDAACQYCTVALNNVPLASCLAVAQNGFQSLSISAATDACLGGVQPAADDDDFAHNPSRALLQPQSQPTPELWLTMMAQVLDLNYCDPTQAGRVTLVKLGAADGACRPSLPSTTRAPCTTPASSPSTPAPTRRGPLCAARTAAAPTASCR